MLERVLDSIIPQMVDIGKIQFGFVPGRGTIDAIFHVRQLQEKYRAVNKPLYFLELRNGQFVLSKACTTTPEFAYG